MEKIDITPELARDWLRSVDVQRTLRKTRVARYADDMRAGRWGEDITPIVFDTNGNLANGQHRLHAIAESGTTQSMWVLRGVSPEAITQMDTGAPRSVGDQLKFAGVANYANIGSIARTVLRYDIYPDLVWTGNSDVSNAQIVEEVSRNEQLYAEAAQMGEAVRRSLRRAPAAPYSALFVLVERDSANAHMWDRWHTGVTTGANLSSDDPRLALRSFYLRDDVRHWGKTQSRLLATIWAWNKYVDDEPVRLLRSPRRDEMPMKKVR